MPTAPRLERYAEKRDFSRTPEPAPGTAPRKAGHTLAYTMQKHAARRLHFDLRLEHDAPLLSFAITKGPSLDPAQKRLAVRTLPVGMCLPRGLSHSPALALNQLNGSLPLAVRGLRWHNCEVHAGRICSTGRRGSVEEGGGA